MKHIEALLKRLKIALEHEFVYREGKLIGPATATSAITTYMRKTLSGELMEAEELISLGHELIEAGTAKMTAARKKGEV
jgi:hypothetical protein